MTSRIKQEAWPCWTCVHRAGPDRTGTHSCMKPLPPTLSMLERRNLKSLRAAHQRYIGTTAQLLGETPNDTPECPVWERRE